MIKLNKLNQPEGPISDPLLNYNLQKERENIENAIAAGMTIIKGNDNTILLDLDTKAGQKQFLDNLEMVDDKFDAIAIEAWASKSGAGRCHVKLLIRNGANAAQRVALQAILGSDPKREIFGIWKLANGIEEPNLLFRPRGAIVITDFYEVRELLASSPDVPF